MRSPVVVIVAAMLFGSAAGGALAQGKEENPARKRVPVNFLKDVQVRLEKAENLLKKGKKTTPQQLDAARLEIREARLEIKEFLVDMEERKPMLPAYDCCPCRGGSQTTVTTPDGKVEVTVNVKDGAVETGPQPAPVPGVVPVNPMDEAKFRALMVALNEQGFADDKLTVLAAAVKDAVFSVAQVKEILSQLSFPDDKLAALRMLKGRITDKDNLFQIYGAFVHSSDKDEARKILEEK